MDKAMNNTIGNGISTPSSQEMAKKYPSVMKSFVMLIRKFQPMIVSTVAKTLPKL